MTKNDDGTTAFLLHVSAFIGYLFPFGGILTPLVIWQTLKYKNIFLDNHGKEVVNFNISFGLYKLIIAGALCINLIGFFFHHNPFFFFGWVPIVLIFEIIRVSLILIAASKAKNGENYEYPMTIKFIK